MAVVWSWYTERASALAVAAGVPALGPHVGVAAMSLGAWVAIQQCSQRVSPRLFPRTFARLSPRTRKHFDIHVVSLVHSLLVTTLAFLAWNRIRKERNALAAGISPAGVFASRPVVTDPLVAHYPPSAVERWVGYDGPAGNVLAICLGYFVWDAYTTVRVRLPSHSTDTRDASTRSRVLTLRCTTLTGRRRRRQYLSVSTRRRPLCSMVWCAPLDSRSTLCVLMSPEVGGPQLTFITGTHGHVGWPQLHHVGGVDS